MNMITFTERQLDRKYKHASDFGVTANNNGAGREAFRQAVLAHVTAATTRAVVSFYRGVQGPATHYVDVATGLDVIAREDGSFVTGMIMREAQLRGWGVLDAIAEACSSVASVVMTIARYLGARKAVGSKPPPVPGGTRLKPHLRPL
jgi:hypothetical protein